VVRKSAADCQVYNQIDIRLAKCLRRYYLLLLIVFAKRDFLNPATSIGGVFFMQISKEALDLKALLKNLCKVQNLCICGLLIALYVVLSIFNIALSNLIELRIGFLVFIAAGFLGGPVMGFTVGFLGDMLNCLVRGFAYFPGFSLSYALLGALCGLFLYKNRVTKFRAVICALIEYLISLTLTTTWLYLMYGSPLDVLIPARLVKCTLSFPFNCVIIYIFLEAFQKIAHAVQPIQK